MKKLLSAVIILLAAASCGPSLRVFSDYDKSVTDPSFKTFSWMDAKAIEGRGTNPLFYNELNDKRIKDAVNAQLTARGYRLQEGKADMELHYHIVVEDKTAVNTEPYGYNYSPYWISRRVNVYQYREGTLIIDMMDNKNSNLVWRGWATDVITRTQEKDPNTAISKAVEAIYKAYPWRVL